MSNEVAEINKSQSNLNSTVKAKFDIERNHVNNYIDNLPYYSKKDKDKKDNIVSALNNHKDYADQKILELANIGLSIANKDYYIIAYGGKPKFEIDYKGVLKVCSQESRRNGYQMIVKADTIREGFTRADVSTNGLLDNIIVENGKINSKIVSAFAIVALIDLQTRQTIMQKVEVLPVREYDKIKSSTKSKDGQGNIFGVWNDYETEMAKKAVLRRVGKLINTMFYSDVLDRLFEADNDNYEQSNHLQVSPKPQYRSALDEDMQQISPA